MLLNYQIYYGLVGVPFVFGVRFSATDRGRVAWVKCAQRCEMYRPA
jgi:hypothetical protein